MDFDKYARKRLMERGDLRDILADKQRTEDSDYMTLPADKPDPKVIQRTNPKKNEFEDAVEGWYKQEAKANKKGLATQRLRKLY